jgi:DNA-binding FadR family transcriptional regulator
MARIDFHVAIMHVSGNAFLAQLQSIIEAALRAHIDGPLTLSNCEGHAAVFAAIADGDAAAARIQIRYLIGPREGQTESSMINTRQNPS